MAATGCSANEPNRELVYSGKSRRAAIKARCSKTLLAGRDQVAVRDLARFPTGTTSAARFGQSRPRSDWRSPPHCISPGVEVGTAKDASTPGYVRLDPGKLSCGFGSHPYCTSGVV